MVVNTRNSRFASICLKICHIELDKVQQHILFLFSGMLTKKATESKNNHLVPTIWASHMDHTSKILPLEFPT